VDREGSLQTAGIRTNRGVGAPTDEALMDRIARRDQWAIAELYDRYQSLAYGLAIRVAGDRTLAEDSVQEAFFGIWRNASMFISERGSVQSWILSIVHRRAVDAVRRRRPTVELPDSDLSPPPVLTAPDVWGEVAQHLDRETVQRALTDLPFAQRQAIELAYFDGLSQSQIAERARIPLGTVKSRVRLGIAAMRRALEIDTRRAGSDGSIMRPAQEALDDEVGSHSLADA
jgi:RNA polymerase sigma-70 factor, ECF subfamily